MGSRDTPTPDAVRRLKDTKPLERLYAQLVMDIHTKTPIVVNGRVSADSALDTRPPRGGTHVWVDLAYGEGETFDDARKALNVVLRSKRFRPFLSYFRHAFAIEEQ